MTWFFSSRWYFYRVLFVCVVFSVFFTSTRLWADHPLGDFPCPLGARWGQIYYTDSTAKSVVAIPSGYVTAGRQIGSVGAGLDYWTVLVRWDRDGNPIFTRTFHEEVDHNEAMDIIVSREAGGDIDGYVVAGARHQAYTDPGTGGEYYNPYAWLMKTGIDFATQWETVFGDPFSDWANGLIWDGSQFVLGGWYSDGSVSGSGSGYLMSADAAGTVGWQICRGINDGDWTIIPEINDVAHCVDNGYVLATDNGLYKVDNLSPPGFDWVMGSDHYTSVIAISDGYVAVGATEPTGDPEQTDLVLIKVDLSGNLVWRHTYGEAAPLLGADGANDVGNEVISTSDGGYAVIGTTASCAWHGGNDLWVLKTDGLGDLEWDLIVGNEGNDGGHGLVQDVDGDLVATGSAFDDGHYWIYLAKLIGDMIPPQPAFTTSPATPFYIEMPIEFDAAASTDSDGSIVWYEWDFGDGASTTGQTVTHTFLRPGSYDVTLYIIDNHGIRRHTTQTLTALALDMQWERFFGSGSSYAFDLIETPDGGFFFTGQNCPGYYCDLWAVKVDSQGEQVWARIYPDSFGRGDGARRAIVGHDGNYLVAGFRDTESGSSTRDMWVMKLDADSGDRVWQQYFNQGWYDDAFDIQPVVSGGYIVVGGSMIESGASYIDMQLVKIDEDGILEWEETYSNSGDDALRGLVVTPADDGGYLAVGGKYDSYTDSPIVVIKTDADGIEQWRETIEDGGGVTGARWVNQVEDGGYVIAGMLDNDRALIKIDSDGQTQWTTSWGNDDNRDYIYGADTTTDSGWVLTGTDFHQVGGEGYTDDVYIVRLDNEGEVAWERTFGTTDNDESGHGVVFLADGSVVTVASRLDMGGTWLMKLGGNMLPSGDFTYEPTTVEAGVSVLFSALVMDSDGTVDQLIWRFGTGQGDPQSTTENQIEHTFAEGGTYRVTLTAVDNSGGRYMVYHDVLVTESGIDLCPDDPLKTQPGICGCGIADTDNDVDGTADCVDSCPYDSADDADGDGHCADEDNCGVLSNPLQEDLDHDGIGDRCDADADGDGYDCVLFGGQDAADNDPTLNPESEHGPGAGDAGYDGNDDGVPDGDQANVVSLFSADGTAYVTLAAPDGVVISRVAASGNPSAADTPEGIDFPFGFFSFAISGFPAGGSVTLSIILPDGLSAETYYKYGPTPDNASDHWYDFEYDGTTGAEIAGNVVTLHFTDGLRGDDDLDNTNATIVDIGAPGQANQTTPDESNDSGDDDDTGGGSGGGGCFINILDAAE